MGLDAGIIASMSKKQITQERVRAALSYDPETGIFRWRESYARNMRVGDVAGTASHRFGYRLIGIDGCQYLEHRLAWLYVNGEFPCGELDHIDRNPRNNAISNLRECSRKENAYNTVRNPGETSRYPGVHWDKARAKWAARIRLPDGQRKMLGRFDDEQEAANAYARAKAQINPFDPQRLRLE